ncbi:hypothetical protein Syun_005490 [Stephania yunnanensis]|uniref:Fatty acid desaturase domain-containing protein n=1 Tax=Stephania yunnanensis TaxID=152371 RepID=A0AAP0Q2A9_9MAGN
MVAVEEKNIISSHKIPFSDVVAKKRRNAIWNRVWNIRDMIYATVLVLVHLLCLFAPFYFNWKAFWVAVVLYWITGNGVTISYHRNLAHMSFKLPKVLEYFLLIVLPMHYRDIQSTGLANTGRKTQECSGFEKAVFLCISHENVLAPSYCTWNSPVQMGRHAFSGVGHGWHNNHHAFEFSATFQNKWWQVDIAWCVIRLLERVGLATDVKVPSESQKQKMKTYLSK